jgi:hypothetical protein
VSCSPGRIACTVLLFGTIEESGYDLAQATATVYSAILRRMSALRGLGRDTLRMIIVLFAPVLAALRSARVPKERWCWRVWLAGRLEET